MLIFLLTFFDNKTWLTINYNQDKANVNDILFFNTIKCAFAIELNYLQSNYWLLEKHQLASLSYSY